MKGKEIKMRKNMKGKKKECSSGAYWIANKEPNERFASKDFPFPKSFPFLNRANAQFLYDMIRNQNDPSTLTSPCLFT